MTLTPLTRRRLRQFRANRRGFWNLVEHAELFLESGLASVAGARKGTEKALEVAFALAEARRLGARRQPAAVRGDDSELDAYFREYGALADALMAAARGIGAEVAFFWEYHLEELQGLKPLSAGEAELWRRIVRSTWQEDRVFYQRTRDRLSAFLAQRGVPLIDPLPALRRDGDTVFIDYLHYTAHGNELAGRQIYETLRDTFRRKAQALR